MFLALDIPNFTSTCNIDNLLIKVHRRIKQEIDLDQRHKISNREYVGTVPNTNDTPKKIQDDNPNFQELTKLACRKEHTRFFRLVNQLEQQLHQTVENYEGINSKDRCVTIDNITKMLIRHRHQHNERIERTEDLYRSCQIIIMLRMTEDMINSFDLLDENQYKQWRENMREKLCFCALLVVLDNTLNPRPLSWRLRLQRRFQLLFPQGG